MRLRAAPTSRRRAGSSALRPAVAAGRHRRRVDQRLGDEEQVGRTRAGERGDGVEVALVDARDGADGAEDRRPTPGRSSAERPSRRRSPPPPSRRAPACSASPARRPRRRRRQPPARRSTRRPRSTGRGAAPAATAAADGAGDVAGLDRDHRGRARRHVRRHGDAGELRRPARRGASARASVDGERSPGRPRRRRATRRAARRPCSRRPRSPARRTSRRTVGGPRRIRVPARRFPTSPRCAPTRTRP